MNGEAPIERLKAMAHPLRFRILDALRTGEMNVGEIEDNTGIGQPALSQQLAVLRKAGLVETRKQAKLVYYRLDTKALTALSECVASFASAASVSRPARRRPAPGAASFARLQTGNPA